MEHFQPFMRKMHPQVMLPCRPDEKGRLPSWPLNGKPCLIPELFQIVHKLIGPMSSLGPVVFSSCLRSCVQVRYGFIRSCNVAPCQKDSPHYLSLQTDKILYERGEDPARGYLDILEKHGCYFDFMQIPPAK